MKSAPTIIVLVSLLSCQGNTNQSSTPSEYTYTINTAAQASYSSDTTAIRPILAKMLEKKIGPFRLEEYDSQTGFYIDSLITSPDQLRSVIFVITRNSTSKLLLRENALDYYFNAFYLYSSKEAIDSPQIIYDYSGYRLNGFYDRHEIREALREYCFNRLFRLDGEEQIYNINDKRFWNSKSWEWVLKYAAATSDQK